MLPCRLGESSVLPITIGVRRKKEWKKERGEKKSSIHTSLKSHICKVLSKVLCLTASVLTRRCSGLRKVRSSTCPGTPLISLRLSFVEIGFVTEDEEAARVSQQKSPPLLPPDKNKKGFVEEG